MKLLFSAFALFLGTAWSFGRLGDPERALSSVVLVTAENPQLFISAYFLPVRTETQSPG